VVFAAPDEEVILLGIFGCGGLVFFVMLLLTIFYLVSLMKAVQACSPRNQAMAPGLVWLNLVPVLNLVWPFVTVVQVGNSLQREFRARGMDRGGGYGKVLGVLTYVLSLFSSFVSLAALGVAIVVDDSDDSPMILFAGSGVGNLIGLGFLVMWIVYWVQIAGYTRTLNSTRGDEHFDDRPRRGRGEEDEDRRDEFDDDYRPRRRRDDD
jgi:hypothetical protein